MNGAIPRRRRWALPVACLPALLLFGCVHTRPLPSPSPDGAPVITRTIEGLPVTVEIAEAERGWLPGIETAVRKGVEAAQVWGDLKQPLRVVVYEDGPALQRALGKVHLPWLQAWATEQSLAIVTPKGRRAEDYETLVVHELTHVVHYQTAGIPASRTRRDDPFWFREGLAQWTAKEGRRVMSRDQVRQFLQSRPDLNLDDPSREDLTRHSHALYSAGFHLVDGLINRGGTEPVRKLFGRIAQGQPFPRAFEGAWGLSSDQFLQHWKQSPTSRYFGFPRLGDLLTQNGGCRLRFRARGKLSSPTLAVNRAPSL